MAQADLATFVPFVFGYRPTRFQEEWADALSPDGPRRILITCPPEHAKTTWVAVAFPLWRIARDPTSRILLVCNTQSAAVKRSAAIQNVILGLGEVGERYRRLFPWVKRSDPWSADRWNVERANTQDPNPTLFAAGTMSGTIIGARADCVVIDDPMDEENARSELQRGQLAEWFKRTLLTRLVEDGKEPKMICIMTRWHQGDLAAVMEETGFAHVAMPAEGYYSPGAPLWPERFGAEFLEGRRRDMGTALYNCMYLGDPSGLEGRLFRREWFSVVDELPAMQRVVSGWDLATSAKTEADYTVKTTLGLGVDNRYYVLDVWRERAEFPEVRRQVECQGVADGISVAGIEATAFQLAAVQILRADNLPFPVLPVQADKDKVSRALEWIAEAEGGRVLLRRGAWNDAWVSEAAGFPDARHDDQVDSFGIAFRMINRYGPAEWRSSGRRDTWTAGGGDRQPWD